MAKTFRQMVAEARSEVTVISPQDAQQKMQSDSNAVLVDVREPSDLNPLGIIPGAEGTQRLPRLVGVERASAMCVSGKTIKAPEALAAGQSSATTATDRAGRSKDSFPPSLAPLNATGCTALGASKLLWLSMAGPVRIRPCAVPVRFVTRWAGLAGSVFTKDR